MDGVVPARRCFFSRTDAKIDAKIGDVAATCKKSDGVSFLRLNGVRYSESAKPRSASDYARLPGVRCLIFAKIPPIQNMAAMNRARVTVLLSGVTSRRRSSRIRRFTVCLRRPNSKRETARNQENGRRDFRRTKDFTSRASSCRRVPRPHARSIREGRRASASPFLPLQRREWAGRRAS